MSDADHPEDMAAAVLRRDRKRIRRLVGLTVGLWILAALVIPGFYLPYQAHVLPKIRQLEKHAQEKDPRLDAHLVASHVAVAVEAASIMTVGVLTVFTVTALLAAISTIWLILAIRRITLRHIHEGLAQISRELGRLGRPAS